MNLLWFLLLIPYAIGAIVYSGVFLSLNEAPGRESNEMVAFWSAFIWPVSTVIALLWLVYRWGVRRVHGFVTAQPWAHFHILPEQPAPEPEPTPIRAPAVVPGAGLLPNLFDEEEPEVEEPVIPAQGEGARRGGPA